MFVRFQASGNPAPIWRRLLKIHFWQHLNPNNESKWRTVWLAM